MFSTECTSQDIKDILASVVGVNRFVIKIQNNATKCYFSLHEPRLNHEIMDFNFSFLRPFSNIVQSSSA